MRCEQRGGKTRFNFKIIRKVQWERSISQKISTFIDVALAKVINHKWGPNFWLMLFFAHSANPLILWHHLQENNTQTLWLVQDIQMLWYGWCEIHILIQQINWCEIHILMVRATYHSTRWQVSVFYQKNYPKSWESVTSERYSWSLRLSSPLLQVGVRGRYFIWRFD